MVGFLRVVVAAGPILDSAPGTNLGTGGELPQHEGAPGDGRVPTWDINDATSTLRARDGDGAADRARLVSILQAAHAGELAAALAYRGHWRSLWRSQRAAARAEIRRIEAEEWHHRHLVGELLHELGSRPQRWREVLMWSIGRFFGALCHVGGWFGPLYAAGRLEADNVGQYEQAAIHARRAGFDHLLPLLAEMVATEDRHERYFGSLIVEHPLLAVTARLLGWRPAPGTERSEPSAVDAM